MDLAPWNQGKELATERTTLPTLRPQESYEISQEWDHLSDDRRSQEPPRDDNPRRRFQPRRAFSLAPGRYQAVPPLIKDAGLILSKSSHQLKLVLCHISASFLIVLRSNFYLQIHEQSNQRAPTPSLETRLLLNMFRLYKYVFAAFGRLDKKQ